jgi:hypothetical protein
VKWQVWCGVCTAILYLGGAMPKPGNHLHTTNPMALAYALEGPSFLSEVKRLPCGPFLPLPTTWKRSNRVNRGYQCWAWPDALSECAANSHALRLITDKFLRLDATNMPL